MEEKQEKKRQRELRLHMRKTQPQLGQEVHVRNVRQNRIIQRMCEALHVGRKPKQVHEFLILI